MTININRFKNRSRASEYDRFLSNYPHDSSSIEDTVNNTIDNIKKGERSFVIYGEPQSGKTDMMIALTSKLVDLDYKCIIVLVQNNLTLEEQNRMRFIESGINPKPDSFHTILDTDHDISQKHIIFCTKEINNLNKLTARLARVKNKVILDDEADYATPDNNINDPEKDTSPTNAQIVKLFGSDSVYIGVTATPARLDLNNTLATNAKEWVHFNPHEAYKGYRYFFPKNYISEKKQLDYDLELLPEQSNSPNDELRKTFFKFLVNCAYINIGKKIQENYIMLVHTTHKIAEHAEEYKTLMKFKSILLEEDNPKWEKYVNEIYKISLNKVNDEAVAEELVSFILDNIGRSYIAALNNEGKKNIGNTDVVTSKPASLFTIVVGGNIISRGLTFNNLLSMFFSRGVKGRFQQGTYVQRARMFGSRSAELAKNFHLAIPESIFLNWWECFQNYHRQYLYLRSGNPVWSETTGFIQGRNIKNAISPSSSIDKSTISIDSGLCAFDIVVYNNTIKDLFIQFNNNAISGYELLQKFSKLDYPLIPDFIFNDLEFQNKLTDIAIHEPVFIEDTFKIGDYDVEEIKRTAGGLFSGGRIANYPIAMHHFWAIKNKLGNIRIWYVDKSTERRRRTLRNKKNS